MKTTCGDGADDVLSAFARSTRSRSSSSPAFVKAARADSCSASTRDSFASSWHPSSRPLVTGFIVRRQPPEHGRRAC
jgi:hypothetical protein